MCIILESGNRKKLNRTSYNTTEAENSIKNLSPGRGLQDPTQPNYWLPVDLGEQCSLISAVASLRSPLETSKLMVR